MLVSAIIPTLNEEACLERCLSSLSRQGPGVEIVVVDGGSTDGTRPKARKYTRRVYNLGRRGIGAARQLGFEKARGKYVYMTDADCWVTPGLLRSFVKALERNSAVAVTGPTRYHGLSGKVMQAWYRFYDRHYFRFKYGTVGLSGRNTLIRRDLLLRALRGKSMPNFWEDGFITFSLKSYGKFVYDDKLYNFSLERRFRNPLILFRTVRAYMKGMREFRKKGNITSCHLPVTSGRKP